MPDENIDEQQSVENISLDGNSEIVQPEQPIITVNNFTSEPEPITSAPTIATIPIIPVATVIQPVTIVKSPKKHSSILIFIIAIFLAILVGGGSALAYTFVYQNPQRVITDSIINAFSASNSIYTGNITTIDTDTNLKISVDITAKKADATGSLGAKVSITASEKTYVINGDALLDSKGDAYFKLSNLANIAIEAKTMLGVAKGSEMNASIDKFVSKVDGVWVKISNSDIAKYSEDASTAKACIDTAIKDFKDDKAALVEISDLYKKHPFVVSAEELKQQGNNFGYKLKIDETESKAFSTGITDTKIYKSLHDCDKSVDTNSIESDVSSVTGENNSVTLWVDMWSHKIAKIEASAVKDTSTTTLLFTPVYDQKVDIATPTVSIPLSELISSAQEIFQSSNPVIDTAKDGSF